jgi:hypothetical protein
MSFTFILQGIRNKDYDLRNTINKYIKYGKIIISTYLKGDEDYYNNLLSEIPTLTIIDNNLDNLKQELQSTEHYCSETYFNNCYYQIRTTLAALEKIDTTYVIKLRLDTYYSNIIKFIKLIKYNKDCVVTIPIYVRGFNFILYHPSDILFGGKTEVIMNVFKKALETYNKMTPEVVIWKPYIQSKLKELKIYIEDFENNIDVYSQTMSNLFIVCPIEKYDIFIFRGKEVNAYDFIKKHNIDSNIDYFTNGLFWNIPGCE